MGDDLDYVGAMSKGARDGIAIGNAIVQAFSKLLSVLARPAVLSTQVFFRKDMGERYLSPGQAIATASLIGVAILATVGTANVAYTPYRGYYYSQDANAMLQVAMAYGIGGVWLLSFLAVAFWHFNITVRNRYQEGGVLWHSRSDGVPRSPTMKFSHELALLACAALLMCWFHLYIFMILIVLSLLFTARLAAQAKAELYERVLDAIDGQLESEWLGKAIEQRLSPADAHGVNASLPAYVSNEYRKKLAKLFTKPETD